MSVQRVRETRFSWLVDVPIRVAWYHVAMGRGTVFADEVCRLAQACWLCGSRVTQGRAVLRKAGNSLGGAGKEAWAASQRESPLGGSGQGLERRGPPPGTLGAHPRGSKAHPSSVHCEMVLPMWSGLAQGLGLSCACSLMTWGVEWDVTPCRHSKGLREHGAVGPLHASSSLWARPCM